MPRPLIIRPLISSPTHSDTLAATRATEPAALVVIQKNWPCIRRARASDSAWCGTRAHAARPPASAPFLRVLLHRVDGGDREAVVHEHLEARAVGLDQMGLVGRPVIDVGLDPLNRRARDLGERGGLHLRPRGSVERLLLLAVGADVSPGRLAGRSCGSTALRLDDVEVELEFEFDDVAAPAIAEPPRASAPSAAMVVAVLLMRRGIGG